MGRIVLPPLSYLAWGDPVLPEVYWGSMVEIMVTSERAYAKGTLQDFAAASASIPVVSPSTGNTCPNTSRKALFVPSKNGVSASPSPVKVCKQIPLAFKVRLLGDSQSLSQPGKGDVGPRTFTIVGEFLWLLLFSNFWVAHLVGMGFWFYCDFFFVTRWRYLYLSLVGSSILL